MATFGRTERRPVVAPSELPADTQIPEPPVPGIPVAREDDGIAGDKIAAEDKPTENKPAEDKPAEDKPADGKSARTYKRVDLAAFTLDMVAAEPLAEEELAAPPVAVEVAERSAVQKHVDAQFADAYLAWESAGKPGTLRDIYAHDRTVLAKYKAAGEEAPHTELIVRRFFLDPAQEAGFSKLIREAAALHGRSVKILPVSQHVSGRHMLVWMPRDKREKKGTTDAPAVPAE